MNDYKIPLWCHMHPDEHQCGGCWGIVDGFVEKEGESYCKTCEYYVDNIADSPFMVKND